MVRTNLNILIPMIRKLERSDLVSNEFDLNDSSLSKALPDDEHIDTLSSFYKVFGEQSRLKIVFLLLKKELCVSDIALYLNMNQPAVSHQLRILRQNKIVKYRKEGKCSFYTLDDDHVSNILKQGIEHITHK